MGVPPVWVVNWLAVTTPLKFPFLLTVKSFVTVRFSPTVASLVSVNVLAVATLVTNKLLFTLNSSSTTKLPTTLLRPWTSNTYEESAVFVDIPTLAVVWMPFESEDQ